MTKASASTWMPIYIGDYLKNTQHLSAEEHGAYFLLIMFYWNNGGKIKNCKKTIKNITKISSKKCEKILQFFNEKDGYLTHERIDEELAKAKEKSEKAKKSASARWAKNEDANASSEHMLGECSSPSPSPSTNVDIGKQVDKYVFAGKIIKLNEKNFNQWRNSYSNLDLLAELQGLDDYYAQCQSGGEDLSKWFVRASGALASKARKQKTSKGKHSNFENQDYSAGLEGFDNCETVAWSEK